MDNFDAPVKTEEKTPERLRKKTDLKTGITVCVITTLCIITVIAVIADALPNIDDLNMSDTIITLFTNACTAVITYYFTRKSSNGSHHAEDNRSDV